MKWNWGTGLAIWLVLFIGFILYFVIRISTEKKYDYDLVTEQYYQKELVFQQEFDAEENSKSLNGKITGKKSNAGWMLSFPETINYSEVTGKVLLYRPSNKNLDFELDLKLLNNTFLIPDSRLIPGRWNTIVYWNYKGEDYLYKNEIVY